MTEPWDRRAAALAGVPLGSDGLPLTLSDYEAVFEDVLPEATRGYFQGGGADELTLRANSAAWRALTLWPRVLTGVHETDLSVEVLGARLDHPFIVAPTAYHGLADPQAEIATASGARDAGAAYVLSTLAHTAPRDLAEAVPDVTRWFQLYVLRDRGMTRAMVDEAAGNGYGAMVITADLPPAGRRERELRSGFKLGGDRPVPSLVAVGAEPSMTSFQLDDLLEPALSWSDVEDITSWTDLPIVLKGILHPDDARRAAESGAAGIVVSNHGGRQLDTAPATAVALPLCAEAVAGRVTVLVDGGIRRGTDAIKARALGATAVLVGRPALYGLAAGGAAGVAGVLRILIEELSTGLSLLGTARFEDVTAAALTSDE